MDFIIVPSEFTHSYYLRKSATIQEYADYCANWGVQQERSRIKEKLNRLLEASSDLGKINLDELVGWKTGKRCKFFHFFLANSEIPLCGNRIEINNETKRQENKINACPKCRNNAENLIRMVNSHIF